jgi:hypothetical protein
MERAATELAGQGRARVLPPDAGRLSSALRDSGYSFNTALADVVDNSIDAGASRIEVYIQMNLDNEVQVFVADNGSGMSRDELIDAMRYGSALKKDAARLGKFGLGLKTASTAFCRQLCVSSRPSGDATVNRAVWDLDHIAKVNDWELLLPEPDSEESGCLEGVSPNGSGTVVCWRNVDRLLKRSAKPVSPVVRKHSLDKIIAGFMFHASMVYQRFLGAGPATGVGKGFALHVNGVAVDPWDPFCTNQDETEMVAEQALTVDFPDGKTAPFTVRAYVIPRREEFKTDAEAAAARIENRMQGIYVYRENRMIAGPDYMGLWASEPHGTLLRVEFSFDHRLDEVFDIDFKKSRITPAEPIVNALGDFLAAPRNAADDRYRKGRRKQIVETSTGGHDESNRFIGEKESALTLAKVTPLGNGTAEVTNKQGTVVIVLPSGHEMRPGEFTVQPVDSLNDGLLWEPCIISGHHAVRINTGHEYYAKVYVPNINDEVTVQGLDSLLWALCEAELGTVNENARSHFGELRYEVSKILRQLVAELPEPDLDDNHDDD